MDTLIHSNLIRLVPKDNSTTTILDQYEEAYSIISEVMKQSYEHKRSIQAVLDPSNAIVLSSREVKHKNEVLHKKANPQSKVINSKYLNKYIKKANNQIPNNQFNSVPSNIVANPVINNVSSGSNMEVVNGIFSDSMVPVEVKEKKQLKFGLIANRQS